MGPTAAAICNRFSVRTCVMGGTVVFALSLIMDGLAPNIYFLFFSHAAVQGFGRGLMYAPSLFIVRQYFHKRQSLATGIGTSGVGVGTFLIVLLVNVLFDNYSYFGSHLILSGLAWHGFLFALLYRPLSLHQKYFGLLQEEIEFSTDESKDSAPLRNGDSNMESDETSSQRNNINSSDAVDATPLANNSSTSPSPGKVRQRKQDGCVKSSLKILLPVEKSDEAEKGKGQRKFFHCRLLTDIPFLLYCLSMVLFNIAFKGAFTFLPSLAIAKGLSKSDAALVLMIAGGFDTLGRVAIGFLLDFRLLRPFRPVIYNGVIFVIALSSFLIPQVGGSIILLSIVAGIYGTLTGGYVSQKSVVLVDILGKGNMASAFGLLIAFQGVGTALGPPLSGALKDAMGDFDQIFYLGGASMIGAGLLMVISNVTRYFRDKRERRRKAEAEGSIAL
ncbi:monocarboxylate transporter 12 [Aplysia californica]|uniref:Monocarboxylate transporter 12 n=1 Tax=Aplysia californica TaxID=6500 RepID=A0ABM1AC78_APLCA|nr:monocarboxylate transporter 12 [Aplysia californica]